MIRSLRMRMFWGATAAAVAVLAILGAGIDMAVRRVLRAEFDAVLMQKARALASMVEQSGAEIHFDYQRSQFAEFEPAAHPGYFEIWLDGKRFQQSASLTDSMYITDGTLRLEAAQAVKLPDGIEGRMLQWNFQPFVETDGPPVTPVINHPRPNGVVFVAHNTVDLDRTLAQVRALIFGLCAAAALVVGAAMFLVARRTMRPVQRLANEIESLQVSDLARAVSSEAFPEELVPIVDRLNGLLKRVGDAFRREQTFSADIAHELRTPLAGLLTTLEVCRRGVREPAAYQGSMDQCLSILHQMEGLVERLLLMARAEGGHLEVRTEDVNLEAMTLECWMAFEARAREKSLTFSIDTEENHEVAADQQLLRIVMKNLFDNAVSYARPRSFVRVRVKGGGQGVSMHITSEGHSLVPADLEQVFDRFWRKDAARSNAGIHAGLGLGLCRRLLELQHGTLTISLEGDVFVASVSVPWPKPGGVSGAAVMSHTSTISS